MTSKENNQDSIAYPINTSHATQENIEQKPTKAKQ